MLKKTTWLLSGRITADGLSFVFYMALTRTFDNAGIGNYSFAFAVAALFGLVVQFGLRNLVTREVAKNPKMASRYYGNLIVLQGVLTILSALALHTVAILFAYSNQVYLMAMLAFSAMALQAIGLSFVAFLEAIEAMDKSAKVEVISRLAIVAPGFALLLAGAKLESVMTAHVAGAIVYLGMALYWARRHFAEWELKFNLDLGFIKTTVRAALPFLAESGIYTLYSRLDIMMLYYFVGEVETGIYAVAYRCIESALVVASFVGIAMYPALSRGSDGDQYEREALFRSTLKWLALFGMAGGVILVAVGDRMVTLLFTEKFIGSGELIRWMAALFVIGCVKVPYWRMLFAIGLEHTQLRIQGVSMALNVLLNTILIPKYGAYGAVWASVISEAVMLLGLHWSCSKVVSASYLGRTSAYWLRGVRL